MDFKLVGNAANLSEQSKVLLEKAKAGVTQDKLNKISDLTMDIKEQVTSDAFVKSEKDLMEKATKGGKTLFDKGAKFIKENVGKLVGKFNGLSKGGKAGVIAAGALAILAAVGTIAKNGKTSDIPKCEEKPQTSEVIKYANDI